MNFRLFSAVAAVCVLTSGASVALAGPGDRNLKPQVDPRLVRPTPRITPTPRFTPLPVRPCRVDPAVGTITLIKGPRRGMLRVSYTVNNLGTSAWRSGPNQQNVTVSVKNNNTGRTQRFTQRLPGAAPARGLMLRTATPFIPNAVDDFEFGGTVEIRIGYDPDIAIDGNDCNNDINMANNRRVIDTRQIMAFMNSRDRTRSF